MAPLLPRAVRPAFFVAPPDPRHPEVDVSLPGIPVAPQHAAAGDHHRVVVPDPARHGALRALRGGLDAAGVRPEPRADVDLLRRISPSSLHLEAGGPEQTIRPQPA